MHTSTTFLYNSVPNRLQTGMERTIAYRTDSNWTKVASKPGTVKTLTKEGMVVEYDDKTVETINIGRSFGTWSGTTIPHELKANVVVGTKFDKDDILAYNSHYFQKDTIDPKQVIFKRGMTCNLMLFEGRETLEDASSISANFSRKMGTGVTEKRHVKVAFDNEIELLVKEGDKVTPETILCNLRPPMSGYGSRYDDEARKALDVLSTEQPKASHLGVIERIEVLYTGEIDHMSPSLQEIVSKSDAALYRRNKALNIPVTSAQVDPTYRIDNVDIGKNQVVLRYYITENVGMSIGD